jgi:predicted O-methyltransferase YrrM
MKLKRLLNDKESSEAGWAVGIILALSERILKGEIHFTEEESEKLAKASEILNGYDFDEQIELLGLGLNWSVN